MKKCMFNFVIHDMISIHGGLFQYEDSPVTSKNSLYNNTRRAHFRPHLMPSPSSP
ncbi:MAG: hypothetical protein FWC92_10590 [Defluviitaleaceae bacterium]|nr:hypothetical protein [Defluviitaleaceae bacterium]